MVGVSSTATLTDNTLPNSRIGLLVQGQTSSATLRGGSITGSSYAAVSLIGGTTLVMSLDSSETLRLVDNDGVGLLVADEASRVEFDSTRTQFAANGGGDIQGRGMIVDIDDADDDGDGLLNSFERRYGYDPLTPGDGAMDSDGDGLSNLDEQLAGTDPRLADSDGDGLSDGEEVHLYTTDPLQSDTDGDGLSDGVEVQVHGTDPMLADSDGDRLGDGEETLLAGLNPLHPGDAAGVVDLMTNGGFEAEGGSLAGWTQVNQRFAVVPPGSWLTLQETTTVINGNTVPPPPQGAVAAIAESAAGSSTLILRQEIDIPPATSVVLGVDVLVLSGVPFATPESVDLSIGFDTDGFLVGHQFRIDLLYPGASALAIDDEAVLAPLFRTEEGTPPIVTYQRLLFDLTPYAGRRVVLRFAHQQRAPVLVIGIDNVRLLATGVAP